MGKVRNQPNIEVLPGHDELARRCVDIFVDQARDSFSDRGVFKVAISGGKTPKHFFELLSETELDWSKVHLFWVDERYVPKDSHWSNYKLANDALLKKIDIPQENVHPIRTDLPNSNQAAQQYEQTLKNVFNLGEDALPEFDLVVLGMGADGHTASIFPQSYASLDTDDLACVVYMLNDKLNRITLTYPVLKAAKKIMILVSGEEKARTLKEVLTEEPDEIKYPIQALWESFERIVWVVDQDAAKYIQL